MATTLTGSVLMSLAVFLFFGLLFGLHRGVKRSILRTVLILLCAVAAYFLTPSVIETLWQLDLEGQTIEEMLLSNFPEEMAGIADQLIPVINALLGLVIYLLIFAVLRFVSWLIVFPICKIFVKKDSNPAVRRLGGMLAGLVSGAIVCYILVMPIVGLTDTVLKLCDIEIDGQSVSDSLTEELGDAVDLDAMREEPIFGVYRTIGAFYYDLLTTTKTADGKEVKLNTQMDAVVTGASIVGEVMKITDVNIDGELTSENVGEIQEVLRNIEQIKQDASPETIDAITDMITSLASSVIPEEERDSFPIDLESFDLASVDFANEADLIGDLLALNDESEEAEISQATVDSMVKHLAKSDIIFPILSSQEESLTLAEEDKVKVESAIDKLTTADADAETVAKLKTLFAIGE